MGGSIAAALTPINAQMGQLSGANGQLANSVNGNVIKISPLLNLTGPHATVSANAPIDLDAAVASALSKSTGAGAVSLDPQAGTVTIDPSKLLAADGGGSTLSPAALAEIGSDVNAASAALGDNVVNTATNSVESTPVNVHASTSLLTAPTTSDGSSSCGNTVSGTTATDGLLGGALGGTLKSLLGSNLGGTVSGLLCSLPTNLLPALLTSLGLDLNGTVGQLVEGTAPPATGSVTLLGSPTPFNGSGINTGIANTLVNNFAGNTGGGGTGGGVSSNTGGLGLGGLLGGSGVGGLLGGSGLGGLNLGGLGLGSSGQGGLDLGGLLGSTGTGTTPGILGSLLTGGQSNLPTLPTLPIGGSGLSGSIKVSSPAPATSSGSATGSGLGIQVGGSGTGGTNGGQGTVSLGF